ncbi:MAG: SgcJ/EcaC family oxidoreductase [Acidobacteriota bacterium]
MAATLACQPQTAPAPDTRAADEQAIRAAEGEWSKQAVAKNLDGFVSYYAEDAAVFAPNAPIATGKEAIRKAISEMLALPDMALSFQTVRVEVARSGDLAYAHGTYEQSFKGPKGKPVQDRGKYVSVWKKQADGSWKAVADIFNSDLPAPK